MDTLKEMAKETLTVTLTIDQIDALFKAGEMAVYRKLGDDNLQAALDVLNDAVNGDYYGHTEPEETCKFCKGGRS